MKNSIYQRVYKMTGRIPAGRVSTYKEIALAAGLKSARRAGYILSKNPQMVKVPCHRVVKSDGRTGGYSGKGGEKGKIKLLQQEGVVIKDGRVENFKEKFYGLKNE